MSHESLGKFYPEREREGSESTEDALGENIIPLFPLKKGDRPLDSEEQLRIRQRKEGKMAKAMSLGHSNPETWDRIQNAKTPEDEDVILAGFKDKQETPSEAGPEIYLG